MLPGVARHFLLPERCPRHLSLEFPSAGLARAWLSLLRVSTPGSRTPGRYATVCRAGDRRTAESIPPSRPPTAAAPSLHRRRGGAGASRPAAREWGIPRSRRTRRGVPPRPLCFGRRRCRPDRPSLAQRTRAYVLHGLGTGDHISSTPGYGLCNLGRTRSGRSCSKPTSVPCRNCWGTRMWADDDDRQARAGSRGACRAESGG